MSERDAKTTDITPEIVEMWANLYSEIYKLKSISREIDERTLNIIDYEIPLDFVDNPGKYWETVTALRKSMKSTLSILTYFDKISHEDTISLRY